MAGDRRRRRCEKRSIMPRNWNSSPKPLWTTQAVSSGLDCKDAFYRTLEQLEDYGMKEKKYHLCLFPKLGWGSYCRLCIHYCLPLVPLHQYDAEKIWYGGTFHWQSMSGWVDSVLIWDNSASHVWLAPLGHIGVSSTPRGCVNGP